MAAEVLAFNKWPTRSIAVEDLGLKQYISLEPKIVPKSCGRHAGNRFHKAKIFIVERLVNKLTITGHKSKKHFKSSGRFTGKNATNVGTVKKVFELIEEKTKKNPIEVFVKALENAAPREEIITIEYGGARYPKAVECSPMRRIDFVLRMMAQGAYHKSFNSKKSMVETLANEIIAAYTFSLASNAIAKKLELERQADSSR